MKKDLISLTDIAKQKMKELLLEKGKDVLGVRVSLTSKGCSGFSWDLEFVNEDNKIDDKVVVDDELTIFIDPKAVLYILGSTIDYLDDDLENGFIFVNPNEKGRCGCGESFYV